MSHLHSRTSARRQYNPDPCKTIVTRFVPNSADPKPGTRDDFYCSIAGYETPLAADRLRALHTDAATYRGKVQQRLDELTEAGWFLSEYAEQVTGDAEMVRIP